MSTTHSESGSTPPSEGLAPPAFDLTDKTLGEFKIIRRLGKGGMAEVYLAEQTNLNRQVAIKALRPEFLSDAAYVKRFQHEARAAGGLNHPNIVQVYDIKEQDGLHFIAQEYVRGGNLRDFMKRKGRLELPIALHILKQVAAALQVAGTAGIVHRDIKPENILLTKKGEAKVADFGLAQLTQGGDRVALTQVGITMGTPLYMSPEQVAGKQVDHRSDLYSFGAMAYHMLAGKPPFQGENALAVAVHHLNDTPQPLKTLRPDLPGPVCDCIHRLMAKKKDDRYPDAQTLLGELKALQKQFCGRDASSEESAFLATTAAGSYSRRSVLDRSVKQQLLIFAVVGVLVMGAAAGIGWTQRPRDPFETPAPQEPRVERQSSIEAQYFYAMCQGNDEAAWKAVVDFEPKSAVKEQARDHAELRLAIIYLQQRRLDLAEQIFNNFQHNSLGDTWKQANGLAGDAIIKSLNGDVAGSKLAVDLLLRRNPENIDAKLKPLFEEAAVRNQRKGT